MGVQGTTSGVSPCHLPNLSLLSVTACTKLAGLQASKDSAALSYRLTEGALEYRHTTVSADLGLTLAQ